jgi:uncharacterized protein (TIGR03437 family)
VLVAALSARASGQFSSLTTPADGSALYFSTPLRETNSAEPVYGKIFRLDARGLHLMYSRDITNRDNLCTNAYNLTDISVSSAGGVLAIGGQCSCLNSDVLTLNYCGKIDHYTTTLESGGVSKDYSGQFWLSRNGRLALSRNGSPNYFPTASVIDLSSGEREFTYGEGQSASDILIASKAGATGRVLADNGTAVLINYGGGELLILAAGAVQPISPPSIKAVFEDATIDASGQTILFTEHNSVTNTDSLRTASPGVNTTRLFVADGYSASITDDGQMVLYLSRRTGTAQAYLIGIDGQRDRALTHEAEGIAQAILSGDGTVAYVVTAGGSVLKIATNSGLAQELIGRTPHLDLMFLSNPYFGPALAPGKRVFVPGGGFPSVRAEAAPPLPTSLDDVSVSMEGHPAPIAGILPNGIWLLVPLEVNASYHLGTIHLDADSSSSFEPRFDGTAQFYDSAPEPVVSIHEDWSAVVSGMNPARRGEIVHTYALGIGPTTPVVSFGQETPSTGLLAQLSPPPSCTDDTLGLIFNVSNSPVEVLFAGLAPGMVAVYQVDWRVPASAGPYEYFTMGCRTSAYFSVSVPLAP